MMIENRLIGHALALAQHRNFARAAKSLSITQPSLSRSIAALERSLGVPLFDRSNKGVTPTPYGRVLIEHGDAVLKRETVLRKEIRLLAGMEEGTLSVSAGPYLAETSVAIAIGRLAHAHPRLKIRFTSADPAEVVKAVLAERIDVGVGGTGGLDKEVRLVVEPLPVQRAYLACRPGHPLTKEPSPSIARALEFPLVTTLLRGAHAVLASNRGNSKTSGASEVGDFTPQILVDSVILARLIARESDALVPGTAAMLAEDVDAGRLIRLECDAPAMRTDPGVFYLRNRTLAPAALEFIKNLHAVEGEFQRAAAAQTPAAKSESPRKRPAGIRRR